jgi:hypothetical protein
LGHSLAGAKVSVSEDSLAVKGEVTVHSGAASLDAVDSSTSSIITPRLIADRPLNGRNYLDLMQLVAGVTVNRQADPGTDTAVAVMGEPQEASSTSLRRQARMNFGE